MRLLLLVVSCLCACGGMQPARPVAVAQTEHEATIAAMRSSRQKRPVIAVLAANSGTETTDFLVPYSVLKRSGIADVVAVAPEHGPITLMPALKVEADTTLADFDAREPNGADYVIVPALHDPSAPAMIAWIREQRAKGAVIVGICSGAQVLSKAGLLTDRRATGHWYDIDDLRDDNPTMQWVRDRRYVADHGVITTTGVTASLPVSLALVEAIAGTETANAIAEEVGVTTWDEAHDSEAFRTGSGYVWTVAWNTVAFWGHDDFVLDVHEGIDEFALAFTADPYGRTYRSSVKGRTADGTPIHTLNGLTVFSEEADADAIVLQPDASLDRTLQALEVRYGKTTAHWVARQLEHTVPVR